MKWRSSTSNFNRCSKRLPWFKADKMYCMENVLPDTKILALRKKKPSGIYLDDYHEKKRIDKRRRDTEMWEETVGEKAQQKIHMKDQNRSMEHDEF